MRQPSAKGLATREKILRAANDMFYRQGYNATGLDKIIAVAGVAKGNFYHHFKTKEELAVAVLDWHLELAMREIDTESLYTDRTPLEALLELVRRMTGRAMCAPDGPDGCHIRGCIFGNFALELSTGSEVVRLKVKAVFDSMGALIKDILIKGQTAGEIRSELDPWHTAGTILSLMEGAVLLDKVGQVPHQTVNLLPFIRDFVSVTGRAGRQ